MRDACQREIDYLRISVTDRCNLRCVYCMPPEGVVSIPHEKILRNEEIEHLVSIATDLGIRRIRLTGGEPLVRKGITDLVHNLTAMEGIEEVALTTNGILLPKLALSLQQAGLQRVNISVDTLKPARYQAITRLGSLQDVWQGIKIALAQGFHPVKLNVVMMRGFNDDEIMDFVQLGLRFPVHVRFIELMPIGVSASWALEQYMSVAEIKKRIEDTMGKLQKVENFTGGGPAYYYRIAGSQGNIGFISPISNHFCSQCNRLRLTAEGKLRTCLYNEREIDLKTPLRNHATNQELRDLICQGIQEKPTGHCLDTAWGQGDRMMSQIGG